MKYELELDEEEVRNLKRVRNYFGEHDKTMLEHMAYALLDKVVKNLTLPVVVFSEAEVCCGTCIDHSDGECLNEEPCVNFSLWQQQT